MKTGITQLGDEYFRVEFGNGMTKQAEKKKKIERIAKRILHIDTLETRNSDSLDFHECGVSEIKEALALAYQAGLNARK